MVSIITVCQLHVYCMIIDGSAIGLYDGRV